ncbi:MAG: hypothetical protein ACLP5V_03765 [Candidatus Bathyarchaeia archaeon]
MQKKKGGRLGKAEEQKEITLHKTYELIRAAEQGLRWKEILPAMGVPKKTLSRKLDQLEKIGAIMHQGGIYKANPWDRDGNSQVLKIQGVPPRLIAHINWAFNRAFYQYIRLLQMVQKQPNAKIAIEFYEFYFGTQMKAGLDNLAHIAWQKRDQSEFKVLQEIEPFVALGAFHWGALSQIDLSGEDLKELTVTLRENIPKTSSRTLEETMTTIRKAMDNRQ